MELTSTNSGGPELSSKINGDATGNSVIDTVFTGTLRTGNVANSHCSNWTDATGAGASAVNGESDFKDVRWTEDGVGPGSFFSRLYCFDSQ